MFRNTTIKIENNKGYRNGNNYKNKEVNDPFHENNLYSRMTEDRKFQKLLYKRLL